LPKREKWRNRGNWASHRVVMLKLKSSRPEKPANTLATAALANGWEL
jgi:hypothetical protein